LLHNSKFGTYRLIVNLI